MSAPEARVSVRELRRDPDETLRRAAELGELVWVRVGRGRFLLVRSPDAVREVLVERAAELAKPRSQRIAVGRPKPERPSPVSTPQLRRALAKGMGADRAAETAELIAAEVMDATASWQDGERILLMPWLRPLVIRAVVRGPFASSLTDAEVATLEGVLRWGDRVPRVGGWSLHGLTRPFALGRLSLVARSLLANLDLERPSELSAVVDQPDLGERQRQALAGELLVGAVGPLVQTAGWALFLLADWDRASDPQEFVREVTRLHPTNPHITRVALVDTSVGGEPVPARTRVIVDVASLHTRGTYAAFGIGERRCLGEAIALKALAALAEAVGRDWDLAFDELDVNARGRRQLADSVAVTVRRRPAP